MVFEDPSPIRLDRTAALAALAVMEVAVNELRKALGLPVRPFDYHEAQDEPFQNRHPDEEARVRA